MTTAGWIMLTLSVVTVLSLLTFCLTKVLSLPPVEADEALVSNYEVDTGDTEDAD